MAGWGIVAVAVGLTGLRGLRSLRAARSRPVVEDGELARRVLDLLRRRYGSKSEDFTVRVDGGRVTLRGDLPTLQQILALGDDIGGIEGVVDVDNLLRLRVVSQPVLHGETPDADFWLP